MKNFLIKTFIVCVLPVTSALGECSTTDPCAPKKEKDAWAKSIAVGFNLTSGNSENTLATIIGNANKETDADFTDFNVSYGYGETEDSESGEKSTNRNDLRADGAYNYKLTPDWYAGFGSKYLRDRLADVDYRVNLNPTIGYYLLKDSDFSLALEGGPGYTFEKVADLSNDYFSPRVADRFEWVISCTSKIYQKAEVLFDTEDSENYIVNSEVGIEAAISTQLALVVAIKDLYDNVPAADRERNDIQVISALKVAL